MQDKNQTPDDKPAETEDQAQEKLEERVEQIMESDDAEAPSEVDTDKTDTPASAPEVTDETGQPETEQAPAEEPDEPADEQISEPADKQPDESPETLEPPADDPVTDEAVDDIVAKEGDDLLAADDEKIAAAFAPPQQTGLAGKLRHFFSSWWGSPTARKATLAGLVIVTAALLTVPTTRYLFLNSAGVRASASLTIVDGSTLQPLKNVQVKLGQATAQTDGEGQVRLEKLKLGRNELSIEKRAFAPVIRTVVVGWGSNPMGEMDLTPVGSQYTFKTTDFLSGKPIAKAEATSGEASAVSDDEGKLVLTVDVTDRDEIQVAITADTYRTEQLVINLNDKAEKAVKMVPARKHAFVSKRSGKFDLYKIDIDGQNEQLVLSGTGSEQEDMVLVHHPTEEVAAFVSTRGNERNRDGFLLSTLTFVELDDKGETVRVAQSERIQLVDWAGDRLIYVQIASGASASDPNRHRLMSYDYKADEAKELAASNYFNDVMVAGNQVYYAPSAAFQQPGQTSFSRIDADGNNHRTMLESEVWNIFRTSYDRLSLSVQREWYEHEIGSNDEPQKAQGPPAVLRSRIYLDSPDKKRSLWVDSRDGKGVLLAFDLEEQTDEVLRSQSGLRYPIRWLTEKVVIYRVNSGDETADYAMSLDGPSADGSGPASGEPVKIRDVTNTRGVEQLYY
jgi:hypothetical protein